MFEVVVKVFSVNGYHETSMEALLAEAQIFEPISYTTGPRSAFSVPV